MPSNAAEVNTPQSEQRRRVQWTPKEITYLKEGVAAKGRKWSEIRKSFDFADSRTSVDLKDKWRGLVRSGKEEDPDITTRRKRVPWTKEEIEFLKEGVEKFGYEWVKIKGGYKFAETRTNVDLKDKWRGLLRKKEVEPIENPHPVVKSAVVVAVVQGVAKEGNEENMEKASVVPVGPTRQRKSWSKQDVENLKKGVKMYGKEWLLILSEFSFSKPRVNTDLRDKWRSLVRGGSVEDVEQTEERTKNVAARRRVLKEQNDDNEKEPNAQNASDGKRKGQSVPEATRNSKRQKS